MTSTQAVGHGVRVGIVGGAIAGCAAAVELSRAGYDVSVFERSRGTLVGRGAGITTPSPTLRSLIERDLLDADIPSVHQTRMLFIGHSSPQDRYGHTAWSRGPISFASLHWGDLYRNLRRRVPDILYHQGRTVMDVQMVSDDAVEVRFDNASTQRFDLVIFADGYQSLGRRLLFPEVDVQYRGYLAWRGFLDERHLTDSAPLGSAVARVIHKGMAGHLIPYFVPGPGGSAARGERLLNWVVFFPVPRDALSAFLTDRDGRQHSHSLPPGGMRPEEETRLKEMIRALVPPYYADFIAASQDTFAQPIYTVELPAYHRGRICLIGDAGALASPITGSGVFKATTNASDLAAALRAGSDLDAALAAWDAGQTKIGQHFTTLTKQMEEALIWATPDLCDLDAAATEEWYYRTVPLVRP